MARYSYGKRKKKKGLLSYILLIVIVCGGLFVVIKKPFFGNDEKDDTNQAETKKMPSRSPDAKSATTDQSQKKAEVTRDARAVRDMPKTEPELVTPIPDVTKIDYSPSDNDDPKVTGKIEEALKYIDMEPARVIEARNLLNEAMYMQASAKQKNIIKQHLTQLAEQWLFSNKIFTNDPLCKPYKVQSGDLLSTIGRKYKVPYELLMRVNNINRPQSLRAGKTIKVVNGPFHARIDLSEFNLDLYLQNVYVKSFRIGIGKEGYETPTGLWRASVGGKLVEPTWTDTQTGKTYEAEDPDYPLGSRWIGLEGLDGDALGKSGYALHGTKDANSIGTKSSRGCIRLYNGDAILMYDLMMPGHSQIKIVR